MNPGDLRHRVQIQQKVETADVSGHGQRVTWETKWTAWAKVSPISKGAKEDNNADQIQAATTVKITMRYRDGLEERDTILFRDQRYNIREVINDDMRNRMVDAICEVGVAV